MTLFKNSIEKEVFFRLSFLIILSLFSIFVIFSVSGMLGPILLSGVATYLLYPVVNRMERYRIPRSLCILVIYIIAGFILFIIFQHSYIKISRQFSNLQTELPGIFNQVLMKLKSLELEYTEKYTFLGGLSIVDKFQVTAMGLTHNMMSSIPTILSSIASLFLLAPFFTFFLLKDGRNIKKWILNMLPNRYFESGLKLLFDINYQMGGFIQARLLEAAIVGIAVYAGLLIIGVKYALFLAFFAAVLNLVPYVGPFIGAMPGLAIAYFYTQSGWLVFATGVVYGIGQLLDIIFVIPLVFSKIINIHPMLVVVLIIIGSHIMGIIGMILAVPVFCIFKAIFNTIYARTVLIK